MKNLLFISLLILAFSANIALATVIKPVMIPSKSITRTTSAIDKLPADKAALFRNAEEVQKGKAQQINLKINITRKLMHTILTTEPFNKDEYLKKSAEISKLEEEKITSRAEAVAELASKFTIAERKSLIGAFENFRNIIIDKNP